MENKLVFFVNGNEIELLDPDPEMTLLYFLRNNLCLTGSKLGCGEGGCGACTVMVSHCLQDGDAVDSVTHAAINACLTPLCAVHGMAVTTVEGIGSTTTALHPCQERIARAHGSQCGFCTPGFVMSMYALLRNNETPSEEDIEEAFQGNLCRCTGYRPILEGYRTFVPEKSDDSRGCGMGTQCCRSTSKLSDDGYGKGLLFDKSKFIPLDSSQEPIFPAKLKLAGSPLSFNITGPRVRWFRPATLQELLTLRNKYPHTTQTGEPQNRIVMGNTEIGVEIKLKGAFYQTLIHAAVVPELSKCELTEKGLVVGSAVTLTTLAKELFRLTNTLQGHKVRLFSALLEMLRWFAGQQIRNMATLGGNICNASPISDLMPLLGAAGATVELASVDGTRTVPINSHFFTGYKQTAIKPDEVMVSVLLPFTSENEYIFGYKQSRRRDDDIAIVNAGLRVSLHLESDQWKVTDSSLCYGGMSYVTKFAPQTEQLLQMRNWDSKLLDEALPSLLKEFPLASNVPGGMPEYRRSLVLSFFYKFFWSVMNQIQGASVDSDLLSVTQPYKYHRKQGVQCFQHVLDTPDGEVGQPLMHLSGLLHATGQATYTDDIPHQENELYGALIMSTHAHAEISVEWCDIHQVEGVVGHVTVSDVPGSNITGLFSDELVFADGKVTHFGQIIGIVVARNRMIAQQAARKVKVHYADLPSVITIEDAIAANSFFPEVKKLRRGDFASGYAESTQKLEGTIRMGGQDHFYLEPCVCLAIPKKENGEMDVFAATQNASGTQNMVAEALGVPANKVVTHVKRIGGGFGGKGSRSFPLSTATAVAAHKCQKPVRVVMERNEDMLGTGGRHPFLGKYRVGFNADGTVTALELEMYSNGGYSIDCTYGVNSNAAGLADNSYNIPNLSISVKGCKTNMPSNTAFRGFGGPQGMMMAEQVMSQVAAYLKMSPEELRQKNMYHEGDITPHGISLTNCTIRRCWKELIESSSFSSRKKLVDDFNKLNRWKKRGIAAVPTKYGVSFGAHFLNQGGALLHVYTDGSILLTHGGMEMGQGLHTKMVQVCTKVLKVPYEIIHIQETSSNLVPNASSTGASSSTDLYGMAVKNCCDQIVERLAPVKEDLPDATWVEVIKEAYSRRINLSVQGFHFTPNLYMNWETGKGNEYNYFTYGTSCSEVEVDTLTGDFTVLRTDIVMDVGDSINPAIDIGQVEGAFTQGLGLFTLEQCVYLEGTDRIQRGDLFTTGPGTYKVPSCEDIPKDFRVSLLGRAPNPKAIFSSKGVGEPPLFLAASVWFAIESAVRASRISGGYSDRFQLQLPATCERIRLAALDPLLDQVKSSCSYTNDAKQWTIDP